MLTAEQLAELTCMAHICARNGRSEYDIYGLVTDAISLYKTPHSRFIIFPQNFMHWKGPPGRDPSFWVRIL